MSRVPNDTRHAPRAAQGVGTLAGSGAIFAKWHRAESAEPYRAGGAPCSSESHVVTMDDHDQRFKTLIQEFFGEFLQLFFASWAERLDCSQVEWLDKEQFPDPPEGSRRVLDLVAKLPTQQEVVLGRPGTLSAWLALVHIEIESPDKVAPLRPRMFGSYVYLREKYGLPVLPIGLYLQVGLDGIGVDIYEEHFWELRGAFPVSLCGIASFGCCRICSRNQLVGRGPGGVDANSQGSRGVVGGGSPADCRSAFDRSTPFFARRVCASLPALGRKAAT
jgi:hypothetical protein